MGLILGVRFAGAAQLGATRLPDAAMTGVQATARQMSTAAHSGIVLAHFRPGGAAACMRVPMHELFGATVALDTLLGRAAVATLSDRIGSAASHAERVEILDATLVARIAGTMDAVASKRCNSSRRPAAACASRTSRPHSGSPKTHSRSGSAG